MYGVEVPLVNLARVNKRHKDTQVPKIDLTELGTPGPGTQVEADSKWIFCCPTMRNDSWPISAVDENIEVRAVLMSSWIRFVGGDAD